MKPLESRKQLLIEESELNRAQLVQEWQMLADEVHSLTRQARTFSSIASAAASLVAGLASCRRKASASAGEKPTWLQTILKGAGLVSTFWRAFHSRGQDQENKQPN